MKKKINKKIENDTEFTNVRRTGATRVRYNIAYRHLLIVKPK